MFRRWALAVVGAAVAGLCGCAQQAPKPSAPPKQVIRVVRNVGGREGFKRHWEAWKSAFEKANPGWELKLVDVGDVNHTEFYQSRIASGDLPEVIQTWNLTKLLADNKHLQPLPDDYYTKFGLPLPVPYKGQRYATMGGLQALGIAVNKQQWAQIGVTAPPKDWDTFVADLDKLKAKGLKPLTLGGKDWCAAVPLTFMLHANLYDYATKADPAHPSFTLRRDAGQVTFAADPTARKIMEQVIALVTRFADKGVLSDGYDECKRDFYSGKSGTWIMGCWIGGDLEPNKVEQQVAYWPLPSMVGRQPIFVTVSGMQTGWAVTTAATGEKAAKAIAACEALYDPTAYQLWLNGEAMLPTATKVAGVTGPKSEFAAAKSFYADMAANLKQYGTSPGSYIGLDDQWPQSFEDACMRVMQDVLTGEKDAAKLLGQLDKAWDSARKSK